jgi:adenylate cyclase
MPIERERKFLVIPSKLPELNDEEAHVIEAGYFTQEPPAIRVTVRDHGRPGKEPRYKVCFKGPGTDARAEYEYSVPAQDALELLELSPTYIKKTRYIIGGWEVDRFNFPGHELLWTAEWEEDEEKGPLPEALPLWIGGEVTDNFSFTNMRLAWVHGKRFGR